MGNWIKWEEFPNEINLLDDHLPRIFENYFIGDYIRDGYTISDNAISLNEFLKSLTTQELNIFLKLKGKIGKSYIIDKTFIEILNYCLLRTNTSIQRPILYAMMFIIDRHDLSRQKLIEDTKTLEKIANTESEVHGLAKGILQNLNTGFKLPIKHQYIVNVNEEFIFFKQFKEIICKSTNYIYYVDNYADDTIFELIETCCDLSKISNIRILAKQYILKLKTVKVPFEAQFNHIKVEIKSTNKYHDRFLFCNNEIWGFGPSVKDGGKKISTISMLKGQVASDALTFFNQVWSSESLV